MSYLQEHPSVLEFRRVLSWDLDYLSFTWMTYPVYPTCFTVSFMTAISPSLDNWALPSFTKLHCRHNDHDGVSNHQPRGCLLSRLFRHRSKKTSKLRVTGLCVGNTPGPLNSPHKGPGTRKMFPFDDVIMKFNRQWPTKSGALTIIWVAHCQQTLLILTKLNLWYPILTRRYITTYPYIENKQHGGWGGIRFKFLMSHIGRILTWKPHIYKTVSKLLLRYAGILNKQNIFSRIYHTKCVLSVSVIFIYIREF